MKPERNEYVWENFSVKTSASKERRQEKNHIFEQVVE